MADFAGFSEASLLYADNHYLIRRLEQIFKREHAELFGAFQELIKNKKWMVSDNWKINISGNHFEIKYQTQQDQTLFYIGLRLGPPDLANINKAEDKEGEKRGFEIYLGVRNSVSNIKDFRKRFFEKAGTMLSEQFAMGRQYHPNRTSGQTLVRKKAEYTLPNLLNVMETEVERFVKLAEYAKNSIE
jgi:hypothetical protein